jgi:hypothetical protein
MESVDDPQSIAKIELILKKDPLDPLTVDEKALLWKMRGFISRFPEVFLFLSFFYLFQFLSIVSPFRLCRNFFSLLFGVTVSL